MPPSDLHAQLRLLLSAMRASASDLRARSGGRAPTTTEAPETQVFVFAQLIAATLRAAAVRDASSVPALPRSLRRLLRAGLSPELAARPSDLSSLIEELAAYAQRCAERERAWPWLSRRALRHWSAPLSIAALFIALYALSPRLAAHSESTTGPHVPPAAAEPSRVHDEMPVPAPAPPDRAPGPTPPDTQRRERRAGVRSALPRAAASRASESEHFHAGRAPRRDEF